MAITAPTAAGDHSEALGLLEQPSPPQSNVIGQRGRKAGLSETSDDYPRVVAVLSDGKARVIVCYAGIQWIVQRRQGEQWHSRSFCQTKEALIRCCGGSSPELDALPDRIGDRAASTTYTQLCVAVTQDGQRLCHGRSCAIISEVVGGVDV